MQRIAVDAREILGQPAGKGQYAKRILEAWLKMGPETGSIILDLYFHADQSAAVHDLCAAFMPLRAQPGLVQEINFHALPGRGLWWHRAVAKALPKDAVFFAPFSYFSALFNRNRTVTVVHDLAVFMLPQVQHNKRAQLVERFTLRRALQKSAAVIAVSQSTAKDIIGLVPQVKPVVTLLAPVILDPGAHPPLPQSERQHFLLFVGTLQPRKNVANLLRAYAALPLPLQQQYVLKLVGGAGWGGEDYPALAQELGISQRVEFMGYQKNSEVADLYREAMLMVYPSVYEGFGLPVAEALAAGTPVVTCANSSLPEVLGQGGIAAPGTDPEVITTAIEQILSSAAVWKRCSEAGVQKAASFSWVKTAEKTLEVLKSAA